MTRPPWPSWSISPAKDCRSTWGKMAEAGQTAWDVGRIRAARDDGAFSWRNAVVAEQDGTVAPA
jgi:hypothetical protein